MIWSLVWTQGGRVGESSSAFWVSLGLTAVLFAPLIWLLIQRGILAAVVCFVTFGLLTTFPLNPDLGLWRAHTTLFAIAVVGAGLVFGFSTATRRGSRAPA